MRGNDGAGLGHAGAPEKQYKDIETGKKSIYFYPALCYYVKGEDWDFWGFLRNPTVFLRIGTPFNAESLSYFLPGRHRRLV